MARRLRRAFVAGGAGPERAVPDDRAAATGAREQTQVHTRLGEAAQVDSGPAPAHAAGGEAASRSARADLAHPFTAAQPRDADQHSPVAAAGGGPRGPPAGGARAA